LRDFVQLAEQQPGRKLRPQLGVLPVTWCQGHNFNNSETLINLKSIRKKTYILVEKRLGDCRYWKTVLLPLSNPSAKIMQQE